MRMIGFENEVLNGIGASVKIIEALKELTFQGYYKHFLSGE
ncbi:hypothetical protein [Chryseobacterium sp. T20]